MVFRVYFGLLVFSVVFLGFSWVETEFAVSVWVFRSFGGGVGLCTGWFLGFRLFVCFGEESELCFGVD